MVCEGLVHFFQVTESTSVRVLVPASLPCCMEGLRPRATGEGVSGCQSEFPVEGQVAAQLWASGKGATSWQEPGAKERQERAGSPSPSRAHPQGPKDCPQPCHPKAPQLPGTNLQLRPWAGHHPHHGQGRTGVMLPVSTRGSGEAPQCLPWLARVCATQSKGQPPPLPRPSSRWAPDPLQGTSQPLPVPLPLPTPDVCVWECPWESQCWELGPQGHVFKMSVGSRRR